MKLKLNDLLSDARNDDDKIIILFKEQLTLKYIYRNLSQ